MAASEEISQFSHEPKGHMMLTKCTQCQGRILGGGRRYLDETFCCDNCLAGFQCAMVDRLLPEETVAERIDTVFHGRCPQCGDAGPCDLYSATTVTGMLVMFQVRSRSVICCAACGRRNRFKAALHCLLAGWWGPRAACFNLFMLPANVIAGLFARQPYEPSPALVRVVKSAIADELHPAIAAVMERDAASV